MPHEAEVIISNSHSAQLAETMPHEAEVISLNSPSPSCVDMSKKKKKNFPNIKNVLTSDPIKTSYEFLVVLIGHNFGLTISTN
jgi:hypothetical protein